MFKNILAFVAIGFTAAAVHAAPVAVDFSTFAYGTAVTNQVAGVHFSLLGGPGPTTAPTTNGSYLTNSVTAGGYPTANILDIAFNGIASGVKFGFNPEGYCYCESGRGDTYFKAFDINGNLIESGKLGAVTSGGFGNFALTSANVHELQLNNGTNGSDSWWFGLASLNAEVRASDVPEPASISILAAGLLGVAATRRRKVK